MNGKETARELRCITQIVTSISKSVRPNAVRNKEQKCAMHGTSHQERISANTQIAISEFSHPLVSRITMWIGRKQRSLRAKVLYLPFQPIKQMVAGRLTMTTQGTWTQHPGFFWKEHLRVEPAGIYWYCASAIKLEMEAGNRNPGEKTNERKMLALIRWLIFRWFASTSPVHLYPVI